MVKERRCNLFDDNGKPRRLKDGTKGCQRDASVCHFAHPHERDWETARPSHPPKSESVADSDSNFYYILMHSDRHDPREKGEREREWEREIQKRKSSSFLDSPPHRRDSTVTRPSPRPPSSRRSTFDGSGATRSPALSSSSDQLERLRKDSLHRPSDLPLSRRDYLPPPVPRSRSPSGEKGHRKTPPAGRYLPDPRRTDIPIPQSPSTLPPEPLRPPPGQPPPPPPRLPDLPKVPPFTSHQQTLSSAEGASKGLKELSLEEQRAAWHERIDLMFTSISSRRDFAKLESDLSQICLLSNSSLVNSMPDAGRAHINAQKKALELQRDAKRKEINEILQKLIGSNFWPVIRGPQISDMEKTLEEAKKHVLEVRSLLNDVKNSCAALFRTSTSDWTLDLDRPSKRRRLDGDADAVEQVTSGDMELMTDDTAKELDKFYDKITELEGHLVDLENDITQRNAVISDEIELRIDTRLEEVDALYPPVRGPAEVSQDDIEAVVDAKNKELTHIVSTTGAEIGVLAVEVAELITKVNELEARCRSLEAENQAFKSKLAQDSIEHAKSQDALACRDKEIEAIAAALQTYVSQAPATQTASDLPSAEYIIQSLADHLDGLLRDKFSTTMTNSQRQVFDKVEEAHKRTLETLSPKIMLLVKMVNLITARIGKPDMDAVNN